MDKSQASEKVWDLISERQYTFFKHVPSLFELVHEYCKALLESEAIRDMYYKEFDDGSFYLGDVQNCMREGWGTSYINDNDFYIGQWHNDERHGKGFQYLRGECHYGDFVDGNRHGNIQICSYDLYTEAFFENDNMVKVIKTTGGFSFGGKNYDEHGKEEGAGCLSVLIIGIIVLSLL